MLFEVSTGSRNNERDDSYALLPWPISNSHRFTINVIDGELNAEKSMENVSGYLEIRCKA